MKFYNLKMLREFSTNRVTCQTQLHPAFRVQRNKLIQAASALTLCSGGVRLEYRPGHGPSRLRFIVVPLSSTTQ
jgi:hypothetical protein